MQSYDLLIPEMEVYWDDKMLATELNDFYNDIDIYLTWWK